MVVVAVLVVLLLVVLLLGDHTIGGGAVDTQHETIYDYLILWKRCCFETFFLDQKKAFGFQAIGS